VARSPDSPSTNDKKRPSSDGAPSRFTSCPAQICRVEMAGVSSPRSETPKPDAIDTPQNRRRCNRKQDSAVLRFLLRSKGVKNILTLTITTIAVILICRNWSQSAPLQSGAAPAAGLTSFRIVFGERQESSLDYSGSISLSEGKIVRLEPWRFFGGDAVQEPNQWRLTIKR